MNFRELIVREIQDRYKEESADQQIDETKANLRGLGLDDNIKTE